MKIKTSFAAIVVAFSLAACGGSDNASKVSGSYKGDMEIFVNGEHQLTFEDKTVTLEKVTDDSVKVVVEAMQMSGHSAVPPMEIVSKIKGNGAIAGNIDIDSHAFKITGRYEGEADGETLNLKMSVNFGAMPMPVDITFDGKNNIN